MMGSRKRAFWVAGAAAVIGGAIGSTIGLPPKAQATHAEAGALVDSYWDIYFYNVSTRGQEEVNETRNIDLDPLWRIETRLSGYTGSDVGVADAVYNQAFYGQYTCLDSSGSRCVRARIRFDTDNIHHAATDSDRQWQMATCHEFGHAGGLGHRPEPGIGYSGCMGVGDAVAGGFYGYFDTHDKNTINSYYD